MVWGIQSPWGITSWGASASGAVVVLPPDITVDGIKALDNALGVDLMFENDYMLSAAGDYILLKGLPAFIQSIYHRCITKPGELAARPGYGVGVAQFVKKRNRPSELNDLEQRLHDQLSLERRVQEIVKIAIEPLANEQPGITIGLKIRAADTVLDFRPLAFTEGVETGAIR